MLSVVQPCLLSPIWPGLSTCITGQSQPTSLHICILRLYWAVLDTFIINPQFSYSSGAQPPNGNFGMFGFYIYLEDRAWVIIHGAKKCDEKFVRNIHKKFRKIGDCMREYNGCQVVSVIGIYWSCDPPSQFQWFLSVCARCENFENCLTICMTIIDISWALSTLFFYCEYECECMQLAVCMWFKFPISNGNVWKLI